MNEIQFSNNYACREGVRVKGYESMRAFMVRGDNQLK